METLMSGGILMIPLGICALLGLAFIIERFVVLGKVPDDDTAQAEFEAAERILLNEGEVAAAQHCNAGEGPLNFVFASLLKRFDTLMIELREFKDTNERLAQMAEKAGAGSLGNFMIQQKELSDMKEELVLETEEAGKSYLGKSLVLLNTIGNIAPLLGLLGTILGMITAFEAIAVAGTGDPKVVAGGISQALVTTATGLSIAIPAIVAYRYFARRADGLRGRLEVYGHAFANALLVAGQSQMDRAEAS